MKHALPAPILLALALILALPIGCTWLLPADSATAPPETPTPAPAPPTPLDEPTPTAAPLARWDALAVIAPSNAASLAQMEVYQTGPDARIVWSPSSREFAASAGQDIHLYSLEQPGEPLHVLQGHTQPVNAVAFFPNGAPLASVAQDGSLKLWDPAGGLELLSLDLTAFFEYALWADWIAFSPDGTQLAVFAGQDSTLYLWETVNLGSAPPAAIPWFDHAGPIANVLLSPDWQTLAWWSRGTLQLMDIHGQAIGAPLHHEDFITDLAFTPDGQALLVQTAETNNQGGFAGVVIAYQTQTGERLQTQAFADFVARFAISPDGLTAAASSGVELRLWEWTTGTELAPPIELPAPAQGLVFSPDGALLAAGDDQGRVSLFEGASGSVVASFQAQAGLNGLVFVLEGRALAVHAYDGVVSLWGVLE